jgi:dTDP-4-amino-4,6-dideoxygalactose transaminase
MTVAGGEEAVSKGTRAVPYVDLGAQHRRLESQLLDAARRVLSSGTFILGGEVERLEQAVAAISGVPFSVGVGSCTTALALAFRALGIGRGDEVLTAPNSFLASASAIALAGATPRFADVGPDYNLDPEDLERRITSRTRAILPVHLTGRPARIAPIRALAESRGLEIVEDCAQAIGAEYDGERVGGFGRLACFSFHPLKNLGACGDAGAIVTKDGNLASWLGKARNHGLRDRDTCEFWSHNTRLDALQAAFLSVKLDRIEEWTEIRRRNATFYREALARVPELTLPQPEEKGMRAVYHAFVVRHAQRDRLMEYLAERGVETKIHYPIPIHLQPAASDLGYRRGDFPECERQSESILSLPIHEGLGERDLESVVTAIRTF